MHAARRTGGFAILFVLGVLALLSILGSAFISVSRVESRLGRHYVDAVNARIAAESGVEFAISRLLPYAGQVPDSEFLEAIRFDDMNTVADPWTAKVSFQASAKSPTRSCDFPQGLIRLRVTDDEGGINLNDTNLALLVDTDTWEDGDVESDAADAAASVGRLWNILRELGNVLFADESPADPEASDNSLGARIATALMKRRECLPGERFSTMEEVRDTLVPAVLDEAQFDHLEPHLTLRAWQDPGTLRPAFACQLSRITSDVPGLRRYAPGGASYFSIVDSRGLSHEQECENDMFLWSDWQSRRYELEARSPVNVNRVAPELLEALIRPLQGWYLREGPGGCSSLDFRAFAVRQWKGVPGPSFSYACQDSFAPYNVRATPNPRPESTSFYYEEEESMVTDRTLSRMGQAMLTPALSGFLDGQFPRLLSQQLYDRIHGVNGDHGIPIRTWQEFESVLDTALAALLPDDSDELDRFRETWLPQPCPQDMGGRWSGWWNPPTYFNPRYNLGSNSRSQVDVAYWRPWCRNVLRDLLLAAFNPNSQLNTGNPDRHLWRHIDKAHLARHTTELCFQESGRFTVESEGLIGEVSDVRARRRVRAELELWRPLRLTTQAQFMRGFDTPQSFGDDPVVRFNTVPVQWDSVVTSYPEPLLRNPSDGTADGSYLRHSDYDGYLMPSTWRMDPNEIGQSGNTVTFTADFGGRLEPSLLQPAGLPPPAPSLYQFGDSEHTWVYFPTNVSGPNGIGRCWMPEWGWETVLARRNSPYGGGSLAGMGRCRLRNLSTVNPLTSPRRDDGEVAGCLLPDGALSDAGRGLAWRGGNFGSNRGKQGAVAFWFKPNFDPSCTSRIRCLFDLSADPAAHPSLYQTLGVWFFPHYGYHANEVCSTGISTYLTDTTTYRDCWMAASPCSFVYSVMGSKQGAFKIGDWSSTSFVETHVATPTAVSRFPNQVESQRATHNAYYFEARQWSHAVIGWDIRLPTAVAGVSRNSSSRLLVINGRNPGTDEPLPAGCFAGERVGALVPFQEGQGCYIHDDATTYARFGGLGSQVCNNYVGDFTFDEILGFAGTNVPQAVLDAYRTTGRYYNPRRAGQMAVYQSPVIDALRECGVTGNAASLLAVAWTAYWPKYNERRNYVTGDDGEVENPQLLPVNVNDLDGEDPLRSILHWRNAFDPVSMDVGVVAPDGATRWACDSNGNGDAYDDVANTFTYAGGSRLKVRNSGAPLLLRTGETFRFRVYFNQAPGQIAYEAPVLDDITFFIGVRRVESWQEMD